LINFLWLKCNRALPPPPPLKVAKTTEMRDHIRAKKEEEAARELERRGREMMERKRRSELQFRYDQAKV
jgi:hypothetical protein